MPLSLEGIWINLYSTPATNVNFNVVSEMESYQAEGERQRRASGRFVTIITPGVPKDLSFTADRLTRATYNTLLTFVGQFVFIRDPRGRVLWGTIFSVQGEESLFSDEILNVELSVLQSGLQTAEV